MIPKNYVSKDLFGINVKEKQFVSNTGNMVLMKEFFFFETICVL